MTNGRKEYLIRDRDNGEIARYFVMYELFESGAEDWESLIKEISGDKV